MSVLFPINFSPSNLALPRRRTANWINPVFMLFLWLAASLSSAPVANAAAVTWFTPTDASSSNANPPPGTSYTNNFGVAFTTGPSGNYRMGWVQLDLSTSNITTGSGSFKLSLRNTTNSTAYSAAAGSTE
jgi:hypothetical protein